MLIFLVSQFRSQTRCQRGSDHRTYQLQKGADQSARWVRRRDNGIRVGQGDNEAAYSRILKIRRRAPKVGDQRYQEGDLRNGDGSDSIGSDDREYLWKADSGVNGESKQ